MGPHHEKTSMVPSIRKIRKTHCVFSDFAGITDFAYSFADFAETGGGDDQRSEKNKTFDIPHFDLFGSDC